MSAANLPSVVDYWCLRVLLYMTLFVCLSLSDISVCLVVGCCHRQCSIYVVVFTSHVCSAGRRRFTLAQSDSLLTRMRSVASDELTQMMQRRMSQENPIRASETELVQRLQRLVVLAVNRFIYQGTKWESLSCSIIHQKQIKTVEKPI